MYSDKREMAGGRVFRRVEKKYLITQEEKAKLLELCGNQIVKNRYFISTVCSVYFDTKNDDLIIKQIDKPLDKPIFKEKLRLRSYNVPKKDDKVFLEIKMKQKDLERNAKIGDKRRLEITLKDYNDFEKGKTTLQEIAARKTEKTNDEQIAKEIEYIMRHLDLAPKIFIACERESYEGAKDDSLRLTFDSDLRYRTKKIGLEHGAEGKKYFENEKNIILEIKAAGGMPLWLVKALSELKIYPQPFSKYGKIYQQVKGKNNVQHHL